MGFQQRDYGRENILIPSSVIGYRQWKWDSKGLLSMKGTYWEEGKSEAECLRYTSAINPSDDVVHASPEADCSCGIYAHYLPLVSYQKWDSNVFGVIEASGRILMGTKGFRAEKARIVALAGYGPCTEWFENEETVKNDSLVDFCTAIGVPYFSTVEKMVHEFPQVDLTSLGVPSLDSWKREVAENKERRELQKSRFFRQATVNRQKDTLTMAELRLWGFGDSQRTLDTFKHLGGYS